MFPSFDSIIITNFSQKILSNKKYYKILVSFEIYVKNNTICYNNRDKGNID
jgi:hypothetical protein